MHKSIFYGSHHGRSYLILAQLENLKILFIFTVCLLTTSYTPAQRDSHVFDNYISNLQLNFRNVGGVVQSDSARSVFLRKIDRLITKYNRAMDKQLRYQIANTIVEMSLKYSNLNVDLICATISHESAFSWRPDVVSRAGALGLMQIMPYTGYVLARSEGIPWLGDKEVLFNPINNIKMGCRYLSGLINRYEIDGGLAAYNGGERQAVRWIASGKDDEVLVDETREYIPAVLRLYESYRN